MGLVRQNQAGIQRQRGQRQPARQFLQEALALAEATLDRVGLAAARLGLGRLALEDGDLPTARATIRESLALSRDLGHPAAMADGLEALALTVAAALPSRQLRAGA